MSVLVATAGVLIGLFVIVFCATFLATVAGELAGTPGTDDGGGPLDAAGAALPGLAGAAATARISAPARAPRPSAAARR